MGKIGLRRFSKCMNMKFNQIILRRLPKKFWQSQGAGGQKEKGVWGGEMNFCPPAVSGW
jgi:hypothetical protein